MLNKGFIIVPLTNTRAMETVNVFSTIPVSSNDGDSYNTNPIIYASARCYDSFDRDVKINEARNIPGAIFSSVNDNNYENTETRNTFKTTSLSGERITLQGLGDNKFCQSPYDSDIENRNPKNSQSANFRISRNTELKNKRYRGFRRIELLGISTETQLVNSNSDITDAFHKILRFEAIIGLCLPSSKRNHLVNILLKLWIVFFTVCTIFPGFFIKYFFASFAQKMAYISYCSSSLALFWIFVLRSRAVKGSLQNIINIASRFDSSAIHTKPNFKFYFSFFAVQTAVTIMVFTKLYFYDLYESTARNVQKNVHFLEGRLYSFGIFCVVYSFNLSTLIQYFIVLLCGEAYKSLGTLLSLYENALTNDIDKGYFNAATAKESIDRLRRVFSCIADIKRTFDIFSFIIYTNEFFIVYGSCSIFITEDTRMKNLTSFIGGISGFMVGCFMLIYLANQAEKLIVKHQLLKKKLIGLSATLYRRSPDVPSLVMFDLLSKVIKEENLTVNLLGMFEIRRRFVLSFLGTLISYITTLYQLGTMRNS